MSTATAKRPASLASIDPRTAAARRAADRVLRLAGAAPVKGRTFNSCL